MSAGGFRRESPLGYADTDLMARQGACSIQSTTTGQRDDCAEHDDGAHSKGVSCVDHGSHWCAMRVVPRSGAGKQGGRLATIEVGGGRLRSSFKVALREGIVATVCLRAVHESDNAEECIDAAKVVTDARGVAESAMERVRVPSRQCDR